MRKVLPIAFLHLKTLFKTPSAIILMFVMPIFFSIIFGGIGSEGASGDKPVVMMAAKNDESYSRILDLVSSNRQYIWLKTDEKQAREAVENQEAIAAVLIADSIVQSHEQKKPLFQIVVQRKTQEYLALSSYVEGVGRTVIQALEMAPGQDPEPFNAILEKASAREPVDISSKVIQKEKSTTGSVGMLAIGFTIMFMMFGISGAASTILDEKVGGTWQRLLTSPTTKAQVMTGYLFSYFLMGAIQLTVLMIVMFVIYGSMWGNLFYFIPFAALVIITIVGFGLMMASIVKTRQQASALSAVLIVSTCMLGGVYWPIEIVPEFMQQIAKVVPQSWMITGFREIVSGSLYFPALRNSTAVLLVSSILFFTIGLKRMKYE
ncbi:ABC transporter permease [Mesobacillus selenatarsenatis]|uniref:ABC transporter permease n=1 Tax=Mesobacillus selenatarsenatis TaxID=388741 RepID=A0A846TLI6_9BACI|nr:ABC transporter permease [Mesobacillus selenatarsenatis]NKE06482.1 ABC transporter permease [Mesobacillus selenatarsenatis]